MITTKGNHNNFDTFFHLFSKQITVYWTGNGHIALIVYRFPNVIYSRLQFSHQTKMMTFIM